MPALSAKATDHLERRRALGQFFTPPEVADFIWKMVETLRGRKWSRTSRVIDPACGEGVFLHTAVKYGFRHEHCFGVDIDESLEPAWESATPLRNTHLTRGDGLLDDPENGIRAGSFDLVIGNPPFAGRGVKDLLQLLPPAAGKAAKRARSLFGEEAEEPSERNGVVASSSRRDRTALDKLVRQLARYQCWRLRDEPEEDGGRTEGGGLFAGLEASVGRSTKATSCARAAQAIADWPADRLLDPKRPEIRDTIRRLASTAIEVFFTERFMQLAKPGGMIAVIVPQSILASDQLAPLRKWLMGQIQLLAVVSLPQKVFAGVGANASTGIVFARRLTNQQLAQNQRARPSTSGVRLSAAMARSRVAMASPNSDWPGYSLQGYLSGILSYLVDHTVL